MAATGGVTGRQESFRYDAESTMLSNMLATAERGEPLFIGDVRGAFRAHPDAAKIDLVLNLVEPGQVRHFDMYVPCISDATKEQAQFVHSYLRAEVNNMLAALGGRKLTFFVDPGRERLYDMVQQLPADFHMDTPATEKPHYGQVVQVINRMLGALARDPNSGEAPQMRFVVRDSAEFDPSRLPGQAASTPGNYFVEAATGLGGKVIVGLDIGGSDIKGVLAVNGGLAAVKEFNWDPASSHRVEEIIDPIMDNVRLLRAMGSVENLADSARRQALTGILGGIMMDAEAKHAQIRAAVNQAEGMLGADLLPLDAIGLCFPDVVMSNKIVGGATPKTSGLHANGDFEAQFARLTHLDDALRTLCRPGGIVMNTNDGPMAAFTAAVELAARPGGASAINGGVFAHTLGTDLGSGWVDSNGQIPAIPGELYKMIVDLGSYDARFSACDVRSIRNFTTSIPGTMQKYTSQSGAYRLAMKLFERHEPALYQQLFEGENPFVTKADTGALFVTAQPDMRKPFLTHLMGLAADGVPAAQQIFREIGGYMGHVWGETERIMATGLSTRYLYGRLAMEPAVVDLMQMGAAAVAPGLQLVPAYMAHTPLMKQLDVHPRLTVAQGGQSVGAVHFANLGMKMRMM